MVDKGDRVKGCKFSRSVTVGWLFMFTGTSPTDIQFVGLWCQVGLGYRSYVWGRGTEWIPIGSTRTWQYPKRRSIRKSVRRGGQSVSKLVNQSVILQSGRLPDMVHIH